MINACAAAAEELTAAREYVKALESENSALRERVELGRRFETVAAQLNGTRQSETDALRAAVQAKNETITAKDAALARQDELIAELKRRKTSPWKRVGDILIGVAVSAIIK